MKFVKSLLLLLFVVLAGIFVYFKVYKTEEARKLRRLHERQLIRFDLDEIKNFTLARPDSSIVFEHSSGNLWMITSPISCEADKDPIYQLFDSLDQSDILYNVEDNPENLGVYGLEGPDYFLAMNYYNNEPDTLFTGSSTPDSTMTYVRFASEDRVLAVSNQLTRLLKRPFNRYRSRTIFNTVKNNIIGFEIFNRESEESGDLDQRRISCDFDGVSWAMTHPWNYTGDQAKIEEFINKMVEARKVNYVEEKTDNLAKYGLENPNYIISFRQRYGMPDKILMIGNRETEKGKRHLYYAKQFDNDLIFTVELSVITAVKRKPIFYTVKNILKFNKDSVNKIILETTQKPITFFKNTRGNWSTLSPVEKNLELITINRLFSISLYLIFKNIYSTDPSQEDLVKTGLDKPRMSLRFYKDESLIVNVLFGKTMLEKSQLTYVQTNHSPIIYETEVETSSYINDVLDEVFGN